MGCTYVYVMLRDACFLVLPKIKWKMGSSQSGQSSGYVGGLKYIIPVLQYPYGTAQQLLLFIGELVFAFFCL